MNHIKFIINAQKQFNLFGYKSRDYAYRPTLLPLQILRTTNKLVYYLIQYSLSLHFCICRDNGLMCPPPN